MKTDSASFQSSYVRLSDGQRCHILQGGIGQPLVFVHGLPGLGGDFLPLATRLAAKYRCVLIDRCGYGRSALVDESRPMTIERSSADLIGVLDALNLQNAVLVGWSYGGHVVMEVAASRPDIVPRLVLIGSSGPAMEWPGNLVDRLLFRCRLGPLLMKTVAARAPGIIRRALDSAIGQEAPEHLYMRFLDELRTPGMINNWLCEGSNWRPSTMRPEAVEQPCLVLHGEQDARISFDVAQRLVGHIADGKLCSLPGAGHWPFLTHAECVEDEIVAFTRGASRYAKPQPNCVRASCER